MDLNHTRTPQRSHSPMARSSCQLYWSLACYHKQTENAFRRSHMHLINLKPHNNKTTAEQLVDEAIGTAMHAM